MVFYPLGGADLRNCTAVVVPHQLDCFSGKNRHDFNELKDARDWVLTAVKVWVSREILVDNTAC